MRQKNRNNLYVAMIVGVIFLFGVGCFIESSAWARAGGGGSSGSRGSRSYSSPSRPSTPSPSSPSSPGYGTPGYGSPRGVGTPPSSGGWFSRSPFLQGMAGGLAGGFLGNMLFGGHGYAGGGGYGGGGYGGGGGGIGLMDIIILGIIGFFLYRWWSRRRREQVADASYSAPMDAYRMDEPTGPTSQYGTIQHDAPPAYDEVQGGFQQLRQADPSFNEEAFKELVQDLFFRIQAGWMNRSLEGIENLLMPEMTRFFTDEFNAMKQKGTVNRLENIAVRKVEPSEVWQEAGKEYITVLFTANLLDYTVDDKTGNVVAGDKLNPVKFEEFWTFTRDASNRQWRLSAINQPGQQLPRYN